MRSNHIPSLTKKVFEKLPELGWARLPFEGLHFPPEKQSDHSSGSDQEIDAWTISIQSLFLLLGECNTL